MTKQPPNVQIARVYDLPESTAGFRVLVDRLWPRGIKKANLKLDCWMKDLAPSNELRRWFNHDPQRWDQFRQRYFAELNTKTDAVSELLKMAGDRPIVLLYGARDERHNQAVALKDWINSQASAIE